ncbi:MAG: hypothetical protein ACXWID_06460 [Pyrinomonadaceae bacterium]
MRDAQNIYWLFTAAAQTVAAFVAFLLAGYALVQSMMDAAAQADETLFEIHESLKVRYHRQLSALVIVTAAAILSSLAVVFFNPHDSRWVKGLAWVAGVLTIASICGGVVFVISIVDPKKYRKAAQRLAEEVRPSPTMQPVPSAEFFLKFVNLERLVRELWQRTGAERLARHPGPASFREMVEALRLAEIPPKGLYQKLLSLSRDRNLVFHGQVTKVSREVIEDLERVIDELSKINDSWNEGQREDR